MSCKNRLQELLQKKRRSLPTYAVTKEGQPHEPRFSATVTLDDGLTFQTANFYPTIKQAENAAAVLAFDALNNPNCKPNYNLNCKPVQAVGDSDHTKARTVSVTLGNGFTFQGANFYSTVKRAENAAADVDMDALKKTNYKPIQADSQKEVNKLEKEDSITIVQVERKVEKLENDLAICKSSMEISPAKIELKDNISQMSQGSAQLFCRSKTNFFPSSRIQVVSLEVVPTSQNSGKAINKQMINNINSMPEISGNKTDKEQVDNMTAYKPEKTQQDEEFIQQSERRLSTSSFLPEMHKNQLHEFAVRSGFDIPYYSCIREGPPHALRFKATVIFNGKAFQSPGFFSSLRQAEHAAAAVALNSETCSCMDELSMCKNLLQDKAQKEGSRLPEYDTIISGQLHMPTFTSTVKFDGMTFEGKAAKTKKQAEKNAALVAWTALKEGRRSAISTVQMFDEKAKAFFCEPNDSPNVQVNNNVKEEKLKQSHCQLYHLDTSTDLSVVSHLEHSQAFNTDSVKEPVQNMMNMLGNTCNDKVEQPRNNLFHTKFPRGTKIRVMPASELITWPLRANDLASNSPKWVVEHSTDSREQSQKNIS